MNEANFTGQRNKCFSGFRVQLIHKEQVFLEFA
jgi:hypothetical protein